MRKQLTGARNSLSGRAINKNDKIDKRTQYFVECSKNARYLAEALLGILGFKIPDFSFIVVHMFINECLNVCLEFSILTIMWDNEKQNTLAENWPILKKGEIALCQR